MKPNCPYCECGLHTARKRAYACGTMYNGQNVEYRSQTCELGEQRLHAQRAAEALCAAAQASEDAMRIERDAALAEAARDRKFSLDFHRRLAEAMSDYRSNLLKELTLTAASVTLKTFNTEGPKLLALQLQCADGSVVDACTDPIASALETATYTADSIVLQEHEKSETLDLSN